MKKQAIILTILLTISMSAYSQFDFDRPQFDIFAGYGRTMYDLDEHSQAGFVPFGARVTIGEDVVKLGLEVNANLYSPTYTLAHPFTDEEAYKEKYRSTYFGALGRYYIIENFLFVRAGAGVHFLNKKKFIYTDDYKDAEPYLTDDDEVVDYKNTFGFNIGGGISIGEDSRLIASLIYNYKKNTLKDDEDESFNASTISLVLAISIGN